MPKLYFTVYEISDYGGYRSEIPVLFVYTIMMLFFQNFTIFF